MNAQLVIGVDPGLTTGLVALVYFDQHRLRDPIAVQIHGHEGVTPFVSNLLARDGHHGTLLSVEAFVVGPRASRSSSAHAGKVTRSLIAQLSGLSGGQVEFFSRNASTVKTWASDKRLEAAGLIEPTKAMRHARDAARHALYAAVHENVVPDPLSHRAVTR